MRRTGRLARTWTLGIVLGVIAALVAACGPEPTAGDTGSPSPTAAGSGVIDVVASTDVYGNIVSAIGGSGVSVTSIIDDPSKDPHDYQATAQDQLAISRAQLVVENGGGYDDFIDTMIGAKAVPGRTVLNAATISGYDTTPADGEFNEHLWYDFPTVGKVAGQIVASLSALAPAKAHTFATNGEAFIDSLTTLEDTEAAMKKKDNGVGAAITEPVPLYLLTACGLVDKTPSAFSEAVENGTDAAPAVVNQTLELFSSKSVAVLVYNEQTSGPQTDQLLKAADSAGIPKVGVTETLPEGRTYLTWMDANLTALGQALGG